MKIALLILVVLLYFSPLVYQLVIVIKERKKGNYRAFKIFKRILMYKSIVVTLSVVVVIILSKTNYQNYEAPIPYSEYDRITFENFKGLELFRKEFYGSKRFAYVDTSIEKEIISDNSYKITAYFHPSSSYVYNTQAYDNDLLSHEKYHFKITELYARKARQRVKERSAFADVDIDRILSQIKREEQEFQKLYDYDTFHSFVYSEQRRYERLIDSTMTALKPYSNPTIDFKNE